MRIVLQTWGTEGDTAPFRGLAVALAARGHDVTLAYSVRVGEEPPHDDRYRSVQAGRLELEDAEIARLRASAAKLPRKFDVARQMAEHLLWPLLPDMYEVASELTATADVIVRHPMAYPAGFAAHERGVTAVVMQPGPIREIGQVPAAGLGAKLTNLSRRRGLVPGAVVDSLVGLRGFARATGVRPPYRGQRLLTTGALTLIAASPTLVESPPGAPSTTVVTGAIPTLERPSPDTDDIEAFIAAGEAPVLLTPGGFATVGGMEAATLSSVIDAVEEAGVRAIMQVPPDGAGRIDASETMIRAGRLSYDAVLPRCRAVVHHAGAGTTHAVVGAGRPSVVLPHMSDQFYWADRLHECGVAPEPVPADALLSGRRLDVGALTTAIRTCIGDDAMAERARALARRVDGEDGPARAVSAVEAVARR